MAKRVVRVGVYGGSGYTGGELIRYLQAHSSVKIAWVTSRHDTPFETIHKNFFGDGISFTKPDAITSDVDVVFLAAPTGVAMSIAPSFLEKGIKVIDLSADFRLRDASMFERVYGKRHTAPHLLSSAVYGLPEIHREKIRNSQLIANPGCFATSIILGLAPLISANFISRESIVVDAKTGTSGAGTEPSALTHHPEVAHTVIPYTAVNHRHTYEVEQELSSLAKHPIRIHFTPHLCPTVRGILSTIHLFLTKGKTREDILDTFTRFYHNEYFVRVLTLPKEGAKPYLPYPSPVHVSASNRCHIGVDVDNERGRVVVFSAIDNLGKGASGQAVQNMNILCGFDEKTGLSIAGLHP